MTVAELIELLEREFAPEALCVYRDLSGSTRPVRVERSKGTSATKAVFR